MKRRATVALFGVLALVGCENMGLEYATTPDGEERAPSDLVSDVHRGSAPIEAQPVIADGRRWVPAGVPVALDADGLRSVGSSGGQTLYARQWDDAPHSMLFTRVQPDGPASQAGAGDLEDADGPAGADTPAGVNDANGAAGSVGSTRSIGAASWQPHLPVSGGDGNAAGIATDSTL